MGAHRLVERVLDDVGPLLQVLRLVDLVGDLVETLAGKLAVLERDVVARQQLVHALEHGLRIVEVLEAQILRQLLAVELLLEARVRQERLDLAAVNEARTVVLVVHRLDAEDVAGAYELLLLLVPDGDGEHAAQALEHLAAPLLVAMHDGLGVAVGLEGVAGRLKLLAQLWEVVDLAVEGDRHGAVGVLHGLAAALKVDDGQATKSHRDIVGDHVAFVVRTSMDDAIGHVLDDGAVGLLIEIDRGESHESAHARNSFSQRPSGFLHSTIIR